MLSDTAWVSQTAEIAQFISGQALSGLADQHVVGNRSGAGADAEESIERRMPCAAPIEAEHELVQVVLEICSAQSVINAQAPALEV